MRVLAQVAVAVFTLSVFAQVRAQGLTVTTIAVGGRAAQSVPEVRIRKPGAKSAQSEVLSVKDVIAAGTEISLPRSARVELTSSNGNRITLHPGSRFVAGSVSGSGETHQPLAGRIDFDVKKALDFFNVQYERITAAVKGTAYSVEIAPGATLTISVREGVVEVERPVQLRFLETAGGGNAEADASPDAGFFVAEDLNAGQRKTYRLNVDEYLAEFRNFSEAEAYFNKALSIAESGKARRRIWRAVLNLMELNWKTGRFAAATALEARCVQLARALSDLAAEAACTKQAGIAYYELGEYRKSIGYFERSLEMNQRLFGTGDRASIASNLNSIGTAYRRLGELQKAVDYNDKALAMLERLTGGRDNLALALYMNNLGAAYDETGQHRKAIEYHEKALAMSERAAAGRDHPQVALALNTLGSAYAEAGEVQRALGFHEKALAMSQRLYAGRDNKHTATSLYDLALARLALKDGPQAIEYFEKALAMRQRLYEGRDHALVATTLNALGRAYDRLNDQRKAIDYFEKGLAMRERVFEGRDHPQVAGSLGNLSRSYRLAGEPRKAIEYAERGLAMRERLYGKDHARVVTGLATLASAHEAAGDAGEAARYRKQAAAIRSRLAEK